MKVLGVETATPVVGVAVADGAGVRAELRFRADRELAERLMPAVVRVLEEGGLALKDLDGISISIGPGSFTGLRVGVSTVKGLLFALKIPAVGVSTLEALAVSAAGELCLHAVCPLVDAKRGEVYAALFRAKPGGGLERAAPDEVMPWERLLERIGALNEPVVFVGSGALKYEKEIIGRLGEQARFVRMGDPSPSPAVVALLGRARLLEGEDEGAALTPAYLSRFQPKAGAGRTRHQDA